jgi:hypothetical protein
LDLTSFSSYAIVRYVEDVEAKVFHCLLLDDGGWMTDDEGVGSWMPEVGSPKLEAGSWGYEVRSWKPEVGCWELGVWSC